MLAGLHHRDKNGEGRRICASDLVPSKMVGTKSAALFASRMSNERSAGELRPRKMERVDGVALSSRPWHGHILLLNHTRVKWCPQPDSHQQPGV